jgi:hypothetical protein
MKLNKLFKYMALIVSALIGAPTFSADLCKGYTHSRDGEIQAVYNLVINNEIVECSSAANDTYLYCGTNGAMLWGDAIDKKLSTGDPAIGSSVILTDSKKQRYHYRFTGYSESALATLPRFSPDCHFELMYFSPMQFVMSNDPSRYALLVWVRRFNAFLPSPEPSL